MFNSLVLLQRKEGRCSTLCFYYRDKKGDVQLSVFISETRREMFNSLFLLQRQEGRCSSVCFYYRDKSDHVLQVCYYYREKEGDCLTRMR